MTRSRRVRFGHGGVVRDGVVAADGTVRGAGTADAGLPLEAVRLLCPVDPGTVFGMARNTGPDDAALPPQAFLKARASVTGPGCPIVVPAGLDLLTVEAELAVVIGVAGRHLSAGNALDAVAGYTVGLDVTASTAKDTDPRWTEAKSRETFTPLGPWVVTDPHLDPDDLALELAVDGAVVAKGRTGELGRGVAACLAYLSSLVTLQPGDVVLTGAPGSFADVRPGQAVSATVEGIGTLSNPVVAEVLS